MKITKTQLKKIIREAMVTAGTPHSSSQGAPDDYIDPYDNSVERESYDSLYNGVLELLRAAEDQTAALMAVDDAVDHFVRNG